MNSRLHSSAWPIEGASHDDVSREALYTNRYIESFLDGHNQTFLVASKGMGKTLLLRSKKKALEESREGYLIIPRNQEYDDPSLNISLNTKSSFGMLFGKYQLCAQSCPIKISADQHRAVRLLRTSYPVSQVNLKRCRRPHFATISF
jgi:predicted ATP-binding protein involved in virulence